MTRPGIEPQSPGPLVNALLQKTSKNAGNCGRVRHIDLDCPKEEELQCNEVFGWVLIDEEKSVCIYIYMYVCMCVCVRVCVCVRGVLF